MIPFTVLVAAAAIAGISGAAAAEPRSYTDLKKEEMSVHQGTMGVHKRSQHKTMMMHHHMKKNANKHHGHMKH